MYNSHIKFIMANNLKSILGKGPDSVKINVSDNIIFVDVHGSLTILENTLLKANADNAELVMKMRKQVFDAELPGIALEVQKNSKSESLKLEHYMFDIDFQKDRLIMVLIFNQTILEEIVS